MKKVFKKNQVIITALAIMIAVAGYINYSDNHLGMEKTIKTSSTTDKSKTDTEQTDEAKTTADMDNIKGDIDSLDFDLTDETALLSENAGSGTDADAASGKTTADASAESGTETPGEAVLTGASTFVAQAKISREQVRSANKETLLEIINNANLPEDQKQEAVASMVQMTDLAEQEAAAELLLEAKGFSNVVVNLTGDSADVIVPDANMEDAQRAQIEDIVKRKTNIAPENIVITPLSEAGE